jgi:hypothetical protein
MNNKLNIAWTRHQAPLPHHVTTSDHGDRNHRKARFDGNQKQAPFEPPDPAIDASRAFWKDDKRVSVGHEPRNLP